MELVIIAFLLSIFSSTLSAIAGGGGGLIMGPALMLLGLPPQIAVATSHFGGFGLSMGALSGFRKSGNIQKAFLLPLSILALAGSFVGVRILLEINEDALRVVIALIVLSILPMLFLKDIGLERFVTTRRRRGIGYTLYFVAITLTSAFGSGIGLLIMPVLMIGMGFTALDASATKRVPGAIAAAASLVMLIIAGKVWFGAGLAIMIGTFIGGRIGAKVAVKKGNGFVKIVLAFVAVAMVVKLLTEIVAG